MAQPPKDLGRVVDMAEDALAPGEAVAAVIVGKPSELMKIEISELYQSHGIVIDNSRKIYQRCCIRDRWGIWYGMICRFQNIKKRRAFRGSTFPDKKKAINLIRYRSRVRQIREGNLYAIR